MKGCKENIPFNNVLNFCSFLAPSTESPLRENMKREKEENNKSSVNSKWSKGMLHDDMVLVQYNKPCPINYLHIQLFSISTIYFRTNYLLAGQNPTGGELFAQTE